MSDSRNPQIPSIPKIDNQSSEQLKPGSAKDRSSQFGVKSSRDSLKPSLFGEQSPKNKPNDYDIEDEASDFSFNKALLSQADMYQNEKWSDFTQIANSEEIALGLISSIITKGGQTLYDHYLDTKMDAHVIARTMFLSEFSWLQERLIPDRYYVFEGEDNPNNEANSILRKTDRIIEDQEPKRAGCENWRSYNIEVGQKSQLISKKDGLGQQEADAMSSSRTPKRQSVVRKLKFPTSGGTSPRNLLRGQSGVSSIVSSQFYPKDEEAEVINSYNKVVFQDYTSNVVDLNGQTEIDRVEEQLRLIKERERELKQQKAELDAMRLKEQKEQQQRMKQAQLGDSSKLYTFDFNGQIIAMNAIKMEKFPNQAIVMAHSVSKAEIVQQQDDTTDSTQQKKKKKSQTNSLPTNDSVPPAAQKITESINTNNKKITQPSNILSTNTQESSFGSPKAILTTNTNKSQATKILQKNQQQFGSTLQSKDIFFSPPEEVFEKFTVTKGVTLIENGKMKKGPIFQSIADTIDVGRLTDLQYAKKLSLTKQEYNSLLNPPNRTLGKSSVIQKTATENDEVQSQLAEKDEIDQDLKDSSVSDTASKSKNLLVGRKISDHSFLNKSITKSTSQKQLSFQGQIHSARYSSNVNQSGLDYSGILSSTPMRKKLLKPLEKDIINVKSIEILHSLASDDDSVLGILDRNPLGPISERKHSYSQQILSSRSNNNQQGDQSSRSQKITNNNMSSAASENSEIFDRIIPLTRPIDLFNNQILNSGNIWGSYDSDISSLRAPPMETHKSTEQFKEKCTVGQHGKFPRDRLMKKSKQLMSHVHLGSPPVGDTMGHGFVGDGFNPTNLLKVNQYTEEINSSQQHVGSVHQSDKTQHFMSKQTQGQSVQV